MALSGSVTTSSHSGRSVTLNWTATQSDNTSLISWSLVGSGSTSGYVIVSELRVSINGSNVYYREPSNHTECYIGTSLASGSISIPHNGDGTKSFDISIGAGIYNWEINCTGSKTFTLDTIARASVIYSAQDITLGSNCAISWIPASRAFRYKIRFSMGSYSLTTGYITVQDTSLYTYRMSVIDISAAYAIPNSRTGTMNVYLYTYNGEVQIGSTSVSSFTVTVPATTIPTLSSIGVTIINSNQTIDGWGVAVAGYSKVRLSAPAFGVYGSTINSFSIVSRSYVYSQDGTTLNYTSETIKKSGNTEFVVTARDSRGMVSQSSKAIISVFEYAKPSIESFTVYRDNQNPRSVVARANWNYSSIGGRNGITVNLYYKKDSQTSWSRYTGSITNNTDVILPSNFDELSSYDFMISITDSLGESAQADGVISTMNVLVDLKAGGQGIAIGKIAEANAFEVALDAIFSGDIYIKVGGSNVPFITYIKNAVNGVYD